MIRVCDIRRIFQSITMFCGVIYPTVSIADVELNMKEAENHQQNEEMETLTVYGSTYRTTGTKSNLMPMDTPLSYEIYDRELLEMRQADSVNEALRYSSGVTTENRSGVTVFDEFTIRGFKSDRTYYDGLPLQRVPSWNLYSQVDMFATESVELLKGPTSVLYGAASPGGMVNQTAKRPINNRLVDLKARLGNRQLREVSVDATGQMTDLIDGRLLLLARENDGQMETTREERMLLAPSIEARLSDNTDLRLNLYYQKDPKLTPSTPLPAVGTRYKASYGYLDTDAYAGDENWALFEREVTMLGYQLNHQLSSEMTFLQKFRYTNANAYQRNTYNDGFYSGDTIIKRNAYLTDEGLDGFVVDNQFNLELKEGAVTQNILVGVEYEQTSSTVIYKDTKGSNLPGIDLSNPNHNQIDRASLVFPSTLKMIGQEYKVGSYLQNEISVKRAIFLLGVRYDQFESHIKNNINPKVKTSQNHLSSRIGVLYKLDNGFSPYMSYSESFEPNAEINQVTGKMFDPTTASQIEVGVKFQNLEWGTEWTATYFNLKKDNIVVRNPSTKISTQRGQIRSEGVELSLVQSWEGIADLILAVTQFDSSITKDDDPALKGNTPVWVAEKQASAWLSLYPIDRLEVGSGIRYVGETQIDTNNSDTVPSYEIVDFASKYRFNHQYQLAFSVNNVLDNKYVASCYDRENCWLGSDRTFDLTLNVKR